MLFERSCRATPATRSSSRCAPCATRPRGACRCASSPLPENEIVSEPSLFVTGTLTGVGDTGLSINGVPAALDLSHGGTVADPYRWVAEVPAQAGPIAITASVAGLI